MIAGNSTFQWLWWFLPFLWPSLYNYLTSQPGYTFGFWRHSPIKKRFRSIKLVRILFFQISSFLLS